MPARTRSSRSRARRPSVKGRESAGPEDNTQVELVTNGDETRKPPALDGDAVGRVAGCVEILNIELVGAHFDRNDADILPTEIGAFPAPDFGISVDWQLSDDRSVLGCLLGFATSFEEEEPEPYTALAQFRVTYSIEIDSNLTDHDFEQFAYWNAVFNAWPYWREYLSSTINRAQLPRFVAPVMRVPRTEAVQPAERPGT